MNGLIALPTVRNTKGMDIVVHNQQGSLLANLQVKTSSKKVTFWPIGKTYRAWNGENDYYIFVRYYDEQFEAFLESAQNVILQVTRRQKEARKRGLREWAPCWHLPHKDRVSKPKLQWRYLAKFHQLPPKQGIVSG
jgi:hypothetical protein